MTLARRPLPLLVLAVAMSATACRDASRPAMGDANSIIVVAADSLWAQVSDTVLTTLQPRVFAVRDEPTFLLTHTTPGGEHWSNLRRFRQILAIGQPDDPWVSPALDRADTTVTPPAIVEADRVWARNQRVTALVVPEPGAAAAVEDAVERLAALLDERYRAWARNRLYLSGLNTALMDTLRQEGGFTVAIPVVYRWRQAADSVFLFLNDNPADASQLVRWVTIAWRTDPEPGIDEAALLEWRDTIAAQYYDWNQRTLRDRLQTREIPEPAAGGLSVRGAWSVPADEFPQGGPFITYVVDCPEQNRRYLLDAWLYAPARDKYQYMIQLETLLTTFTCPP